MPAPARCYPPNRPKDAGRRTRTKSALTCRRAIIVVWPVPVRDDVLPEPDTCVQLRAEDVDLVQEQDQVRLPQQRVRADRLPEQDRVFQPVHRLVLREHLVKPAQRREEQNCAINESFGEHPNTNHPTQRVLTSCHRRRAPTQLQNERRVSSAYIAHTPTAALQGDHEDEWQHRPRYIPMFKRNQPLTLRIATDEKADTHQ